MVSSGLLRRVALVRTDVSEEPGASFIRVTKIGELGTTEAATSIVAAKKYHSHRRENLKSYKNDLLHASCLHWLLFDPEDGASKSLRNVCKVLPT
jgi:hypothetical protein